MKIKRKISDIHRAAAAWDARLRSPHCSAADRAEFKIWREQASDHRGVFDSLQHALEVLRHGGEHPQIRALQEMAHIAEHRHADWRRHWRSALAACLLIGGVVTTLTLDRSPVQSIAPSKAVTTLGAVPAEASRFVTESHERRTVGLPDGSSITLSAATSIETTWLPHERRIRLLGGQALFRVAKDPIRPFVVTVGNRTVTALGTAFDVKLRGDRVQVTLVEGRVAVRGVGEVAMQPLVELAPHEQLVVTGTQVPKVRLVDLATVTSWAEGQVYFTDEALATSVATMNQYSVDQIVIGDPSLNSYRVNGMFRAGNQAGFVAALADYFPIEVRREDTGRVILMPRRTIVQVP